MGNDQEDLLIVQLEHSYSLGTVNLMTNRVPFLTLAARKLRVAHFCNCLHTLCVNFTSGFILLPKLTFPLTQCP